VWLPLKIIVIFHLQRKAVVTEYKGIRIKNLNPDFKGDLAFSDCTKEALEMIELYDPRRFRRLQREVRTITNIEGNSIAAYRRTRRECEVNFSWLCEASDEGIHPERRGTDSYKWYLGYYAAVLVHEATHGQVHSFGIPYIRETRVRIERLCHTEEMRFAAKLPQDTYDFANDLIEPFDDTYYHTYWTQNTWGRFRGLVKRIEESRKRRKRRNGETD
jgi:hypothetical protein